LGIAQDNEIVGKWMRALVFAVASLQRARLGGVPARHHIRVADDNARLDMNA
jgi:hypothetical protein